MEVVYCLHCKRIIKKKTPGVVFCSKTCEKLALEHNPKFYYKQFSELTKQDLKYQKKLLKCLSEKKKFDTKIKWERTTHVIRKITAHKNPKKCAYGITLPKSIWSKYKRYHCKHLVNGIIVLIPQKTKHGNTKTTTK